MAFCLEDLTCCLKDSYEEEVKEHISPVSPTSDWTHPPKNLYWNMPDVGKFTLHSTSKEHDELTPYCPISESSLFVSLSSASDWTHPPNIQSYWGVPDQGNFIPESPTKALAVLSCSSVQESHDEFTAYWPSHNIRVKEERKEYISSCLPMPASGVRIWHWYEEPSIGAPQRVKLSVLNDWATTLRSRHARGVVHGNLTPESVGIVHGKGILNTLALSQPTRMSRTGESLVDDVTDVYGARWAATEFFRLDNGDPRPTKMSDVYSFSCLMLQVLTGSVPYCATKRPEQVVYLKYLGREPIDAQTPEVADRYVALMRWCWSPEPEKRPSMETIVDFIEEEINQLEE